VRVSLSGSGEFLYSVDTLKRKTQESAALPKCEAFARRRKETEMDYITVSKLTK
jgi:hypothetical protein